ncbi:MAG: VWA domain-containing protein [Peptococcaceae bacterium]|nr:VWA domain-containing protein [Peptococcaceae bacterium]
MTINPIIPIWVMLLICALGVFVVAKQQDNAALARRTIIIALLFIINLRIMAPVGTDVEVSNNLNVLFVIDTTISMLAEDYQGETQRLSAVKADCGHIVSELRGARFSIIAFDNHARRLIPYIEDEALTLETIETLQIINEEYSRGSSLNVVRDDLIQSLESAYRKKDEKRINILFFISDGEMTNLDKLKSFTGAKKFIDGGAVLGYGTREGGYMRVVNKVTGEKEYVQDKTKTPYVHALSRIEEHNLQKIASDMGIDYIEMDQQANIAGKLKEIDQKLLTKSVPITTYDDIYYVFVVFLVPLLLWELIDLRRKVFP